MALARFIPRCVDVNFGSLCPVEWWCEESSYWFKIEYRIGDTLIHASNIFNPGVGGSYTYKGFTLPLDNARYIPNSTVATVSVKLYRYTNSSGNTWAGSPESGSFRATLSDSAKPSVTSAAMSADNSLTPSISSWSAAISGYSRAHITASASGIYGSTVTGFTVECETIDSVSGSSLNYTSGVIRGSGRVVFKIRCTDTRGRTSNDYEISSLNFLQYAPPVISSVNISRDSANMFVVRSAWSHSAVGQNSSAGELYVRTTTSSDWIKYGNISNDTPITLNNTQIISYNEMISYVFRVVVTDSLNTSTAREAFASSKQVLMNFRAGGNGLGIGKVCEEADHMEVNLVAKFLKDVKIGTQSLKDYIKSVQNQPHSDQGIKNMIYPVGALYISTSSTSPSSLFGGSWTQLTDRMLIGAGNAYAVHGTGGSTTVKLEVKHLPPHRHWGCLRPSYDVWSGTHPSGSTGGSKNNLLTTNNVGGGESHSNMPPYYAVYMWYRVS